MGGEGCGPTDQLPGTRPQSHSPSLSAQPARGSVAPSSPWSVLTSCGSALVSRGGRGGWITPYAPRASVACFRVTAEEPQEKGDHSL